MRTDEPSQFQVCKAFMTHVFARMSAGAVFWSLTSLGTVLYLNCVLKENTAYEGLYATWKSYTQPTGKKNVIKSKMALNDILGLFIKYLIMVLK